MIRSLVSRVGESYLVRLTTKLKQLRVDREELVKTLDDVDKSLLQGAIHEPTYKELKHKYESRLVKVEQDIFETEKTIEKRKRARKRTTKSTKTTGSRRTKKNVVTLGKLKLQRDYIQKTVNLLEGNSSSSLEDEILELLTVTSQMGKKLTSREITNELRNNSDKYFSRDEVIRCLRKLVNDGEVKRLEGSDKNLRYFIDLSWEIDSLVPTQ